MALAALEFELNDPELHLDHASTAWRMLDSDNTPDAVECASGVAGYLIETGRRAEARALALHAALLALHLGYRSGLATCMQQLAVLYAQSGDPQRAAMLFGFAGHTFQATGYAHRALAGQIGEGEELRFFCQGASLSDADAYDVAQAGWS